MFATPFVSCVHPLDRDAVLAWLRPRPRTARPPPGTVAPTLEFTIRRRRWQRHRRRRRQSSSRFTSDRLALRLRDVIEREHRMRALNQARRRFQQAFHSAPTGMALVRLSDGADPRRQPVARRDARRAAGRPRRPQHSRAHPSRRPPGDRQPRRRGERPTRTSSNSASAVATGSTCGPGLVSAITEDDGVEGGHHPHRGCHRAAAQCRGARVGGDARRADRASQPDDGDGHGRPAAGECAGRIGGACCSSTSTTSRW